MGASERGQVAVQAVSQAGERAGFDVVVEYAIPGARIDVVWLLPRSFELPDALAADRVPVVGFEIESSWRRRKHAKDDILNLVELGAVIGVIVLLGDGDQVESLRVFAQTAIARQPGRLQIWTDADIHALANDPGTFEGSGAPAPVRKDTVAADEASDHVGKYASLRRWLVEQPDRLSTTFREIEQDCEIRLPASCRRHPAHWHSYEGSAVARAIQDAGYRVQNLNIEREQLTFIRK